LIFLIQIQFGCENNESTHFNETHQFLESILIPSIIVDHTGADDNIIFFIMTGIGLLFPKVDLFEVFVSFLLFGHLQQIFAAIHTGDVKESVFSQVLSSLTFTASDIQYLDPQLIFGLNELFQKECANFWWVARFNVLVGVFT